MFEPPPIEKPARRRFAARSVVLFGLALTLASSSASSAVGAEAAAGPLEQAAQAVTIRQFAYAPSSIELPAGTQVVWTNQDDIEHSVTQGTSPTPGGAFDSGLFKQGGTFAFTFSQPGTFDYFCTRHTSMIGTVRVATAAAAPSQAAPPPAPADPKPSAAAPAAQAPAAAATVQQSDQMPGQLPSTGGLPAVLLAVALGVLGLAGAGLLFRNHGG